MGLREAVEAPFVPGRNPPMDGRDDDTSNRDEESSPREGGRVTDGLGELFLRAASLNAATLMRWDASEATLFPLGLAGGVMNVPESADGGRGTGSSGESVGPTCLNDFKLKESEL